MKNPPISISMVAASLTAFAALYLSSDSPIVLILPLFFLASLVFATRFERDSSAIWGLRLLIYSGFAILGRTPSGMPSYFVDAQSFTTAGLIAGGELCLQAFRRPPEGARFDPWIVSLSGVIFLIACNTTRFHIWILAPLYVLFLLLSLVDLRPRVAQSSHISSVRRVATIAVAVALGATLHQVLWANRGSIMAAGARLLAGNAMTEQAVQQGDKPQLSSSFGGNTSTARLLRIQGTLKDGHLRAASFSGYKKGDWGPAFSRRNTTDAALPSQTGEEDENQQTIPRARNDAKITLLRETGGILFAPLNARALMPEIGQSFNWDRFQGPFVTEEPAPVTYYLTGSKNSAYGFETEQGPLCVAPDAPQRRDLMFIPPEIDPKVIELARRVAKTGRTQSEKAAQIVDYLFKTNPYSLEFVIGRQDPISDFVLNQRPGHCQYFASASVMMLRAVGIPARYVTGYYAQETEADGSIIVRGRDAHAWTEAYLGDGGEMGFPEAVAGQNDLGFGSGAFTSSLISSFGPDGVPDIGWVSLDATPPAGRADPAVKPVPFYQSTLERAQDWFARVRAWFSKLTQLQIGGIVVLIAALWGLERARQNYIQARRKVGGHHPPPALAPLARRFERLLIRRGVTLLEGQPWSESVPKNLPNARQWVDDYNRARFADADLNELRALERELTQLEREKAEAK